MIDTKQFVDKLVASGIEEVVGVPCSTMTPLINECINRRIYTPYVNEGDAVAYSAGRNLDKVRVAVILQNSGLTNASSPISSLTSLYGIPMLYLVGWRGFPGSVDEPQHAIMGPATIGFINLITDSKARISIPSDEDDTLQDSYESGQTFMLIRKGTFSSVELESRGVKNEKTRHFSRYDVVKTIKEISQEYPGSVILSTTGYTSRELLSLGEDCPSNFYMFGSMGCLASFAVGVARQYPDKLVFAIDGDGANEMRLEGSFTQDYYNLGNLIRVIVKNGLHQSTGGQSLPRRSLSPNTVRTQDLEVLKKDIREYASSVHTEEDNSLEIHFLVNSETQKNLPRPTLNPTEIKYNFIGGLISND